MRQRSDIATITVEIVRAMCALVSALSGFESAVVVSGQEADYFVLKRSFERFQHDN
jgi:hypothetical protein